MHCYGREERAFDGGIIQYRLQDRVWIIPEGKREELITDRRRFYCVLFNTNTKDVSCDCRKFETFGISCRHMIRVFDQNLVFDIPSKYILDRWRKDVVRKHTRVKVAYHDPSKDASIQTYNKLMHEFEPICEEASFVEDKETVDLVVKALQTLRLEVKKSRAKYLENQPSIPILPRILPSEIGSNTMHQGNTPKSVTMPTEEVNATADIVKDPIRKKPRGRPKGSKTQQSNPILPKSSPVEIGTDTMNPGNTPNSETMPEVVNATADVVKDPIPPKRPRGRPKGSRLKSLDELGYKKPQAKRKKTNAPQQQQQNTIEYYYEYVEDAGLVDDNHRDAVDWSETF